MTEIGDNGGPVVDDGANPKLRWAKINVAEVLEGIEELSWEQRGYYLTALFKMYARMGGLPADDYEGAKAMRCDVRFFRRLRDQIVASGKFYVEDGLLKNSRVEREIGDYVREFKKRRDAALEREARKRQAEHELQRTSEELRGDFGETSGRSPGEVSDISAELGGKNPTKTKGAPPQHYQKSTTNQNQEPEQEKKGSEDIRAVGTAPGDDPFETFWQAFPTERRRGKGKCRDLFNRIASGKISGRRASAATLIAAVRAGNGIDPQFAPMPETWLNQGRWEDAPAEAEPANTNGKSWGWWRGKEATMRGFTDERWRTAVMAAKPNGTWPWWMLGAPPGHAECLVPEAIVSEFGYLEIYRGKITHA